MPNSRFPQVQPLIEEILNGPVLGCSLVIICLHSMTRDVQVSRLCSRYWHFFWGKCFLMNNGHLTPDTWHLIYTYLFPLKKLCFKVFLLALLSAHAKSLSDIFLTLRCQLFISKIYQYLHGGLMLYPYYEHARAIEELSV